MKRIPLAVGCVGTCVALAFGAFNDDFSDEALSNTLWVVSNDAVTQQFMNGACVVANSDASFIGFTRHGFAENNKPSTFTLSGKITLAEGSTGAGFSCCVASSGMPTGYYISIIENSQVTINKIDASGSGTIITTVNAAFLVDGTNEFKISRKEGKFNIFGNGQFITTFTDNDFTEGDIGLLVSAKSTAVFDDIVLTDSFEEGGPRTCFADDFSNSALSGWAWFGDDDVSLAVENEALHITTEAGQNLYQVFDLPLTNFVMKAVASHRGLSTKNLYGLFICGTGEQSIPLAGFGINGGSNYGSFLAGQALTLTPSTSIKGDLFVSSTGDTTYYYDTLEVIKRDGSDAYLFVVNSDTLSRLTGVNFDITGAGIFCFDSINVLFDDFLVANGDEAICPVKPPVTMRTRPFRGVPVFLPADMPLFDLSGRLVSRARSGNLPNRVPGVYLYRSGDYRMRRIDVR
ncbi:MAG: hypothetical protein JW863_23540 [Chitinispirillaceae bacterium]|nr:hypothetical protein [Chitinispirillaceae bacterium]